MIRCDATIFVDEATNVPLISNIYFIYVTHFCLLFAGIFVILTAKFLSFDLIPGIF